MNCILIFLGLVVLILWIILTKYDNKGGGVLNKTMSDRDFISQVAPFMASRKASIYCDNKCIVFNSIDNKYIKYVVDGQIVQKEGGYGSVSSYTLDTSNLSHYYANQLVPKIVVKKFNDSSELIEELQVLRNLKERNVNMRNIIEGVTIEGEIEDNNLLILERMDNDLNNTNWDDTKKIFAIREITQGLKDLYDKRLYYIDLKPSNVGYRYTGEIKLLDLGSIIDNFNDPYGSTYPSLYKVSGKEEVYIVQQLLSIILNFFNKRDFMTLLVHNSKEPREEVYGNIYEFFIKKRNYLDKTSNIFFLTQLIIKCTYPYDIKEIPTLAEIIRICDDKLPNNYGRSTPKILPGKGKGKGKGVSWESPPGKGNSLPSPCVPNPFISPGSLARSSLSSIVPPQLYPDSW